MRLNRFVEGLTMVAVGLILLGNTLGFLPWSVWWTILTLWPLLLVAAGLEFIGKGTGNVWLRVLSSVLVLAGLLFGALVMQPGMSLRAGWHMMGDARTFDFSEPARDVDEARLRLRGTVGRISVEGGGSGLASVSGQTPFGDPSFRADTTGSSADVRISQAEGSAVWPMQGRAFMDVGLSTDPVWDIDVQTGVAQLDADLSALEVSRVRLQTGVSESTLRLGEVGRGRGEVSVTLESGVGALTVLLPEGAEARIVADTGIAGIDVGRGFARIEQESGRVFETDGYAQARDRYLVRVRAGVGSVTVDRY